MNLSFKLMLYRQYKGLSLEAIAQQLNLPVESYKELEEGKSKINGILAQKLSDFYQAPIELFILDEVPHNFQADVLYQNCMFIGAQGSNSGYVNHQYNDRGIDEILFAKNEEIKYLKQEVERLQGKM